MPPQVHVHPVDPATLPADVGAIVHLTDAIDLYYTPAMPVTTRCAYAAAALTAVLDDTLSATTSPPASAATRT